MRQGPRFASELEAEIGLQHLIGGVEELDGLSVVRADEIGLLAPEKELKSHGVELGFQSKGQGADHREQEQKDGHGPAQPVPPWQGQAEQKILPIYPTPTQSI